MKKRPERGRVKDIPLTHGGAMANLDALKAKYQPGQRLKIPE